MERQMPPVNADAALLAIEKLLGQLGKAGITMRLLSDANAYARAGAIMKCWIDPACAQQRGGPTLGMFWLEFSNSARVPIALGAAMRWQTADIIPDIATGTLWYPGGFAEHCGLHEIKLGEPTRLLGGNLSYTQLSASQFDPPDTQLLTWMSLLLQALALRHHQSDNLVELAAISSNADEIHVPFEAYRHHDYLASGYFPPADKRATLVLLHNTAREMLGVANIDLAETAQQDQTRIDA